MLISFQYGIDLASPEELIAYEKTRHDIAKHINADEVIYQSLDDLKAACFEAAPDTPVKDFEVGVFCGKYVTPVPDGYFEHLSEMRGKKRKIGAGEAAPNSAVTGNGGPVSVAVHGSESKVPRLSNGDVNGHSADRNPENRVDIRYVHSHQPGLFLASNRRCSLHNLASE